MPPETAGGIVRQLIAVTGPSAVAVHGGGGALLHALRDETIDAVSVATRDGPLPGDGVLLLAVPGLAMEEVAAWLAVAPDTVAIAGIAGVHGVVLDETVRRLGWRRHPRSFRSTGLAVFRRAGSGSTEGSDDIARIYDLIANFVRPGDHVGAIGLPPAGRDILIANSFAADVLSLARDLDGAAADVGCLVVHAKTLADAIDRLGPTANGSGIEAGGRLILIGDTDEDQVASIRAAAAGLSGDFIAERAFSIIGGVIVERALDRGADDAALAGTAILILMRDPLAPGAAPVDRTFVIPDDPAFHVVDFARDYRHPALVKAIVVRGMRLSTPQALVETVRRLLPQTEPGGVDRGALLCTLAYQLLTEVEADAALPAVLAEVAGWIAVQQQPDGHRLRWLVSLTSVKMKIEKRLGDFDAALATAEACAAIDPVPFSPLLASRTIEALFTAASIRLVRGQVEGAVRLLDRAIPMVRNALSGDWLNIVGDPAHPLPFGLTEVAALAHLAARCVALRAYVNQFSQRPGMVWAQALALSGDGGTAVRGGGAAGALQSAGQVRDFAGEFYRLTHEASQANMADLARVQALLVESRAELAAARAEAAAFAPRIEAFCQREGHYRARMAALRAEVSARDRAAQEAAVDLARVQALLAESRADLAAKQAEAAAFPPLVEALRERGRGDRARMAMMRAEASARRRAAQATAADLASSRAGEKSARKALLAAQADARSVRQRLSDTFERLADAERRAMPEGDPASAG